MSRLARKYRIRVQSVVEDPQPPYRLVSTWEPIFMFKRCQGCLLGFKGSLAVLVGTCVSSFIKANSLSLLLPVVIGSHPLIVLNDSTVLRPLKVFNLKSRSTNLRVYSRFNSILMLILKREGSHNHSPGVTHAQWGDNIHLVPRALINKHPIHRHSMITY